ncbi:MAG: DUF4340 domain-containing protein [Betaproteobacteria bacterium]
MKRGLLVNIVLALLVAGIGAWLMLEPGEKVESQRALSTKTPSEVRQITIERKGLAPFVLQNHDGNWVQSAPFRARADASKVPRLLDLLRAQAKTTYPAADLARFDLDQPFARVKMDDQVFAFGTVNAVTNEQYVLSGDTVFLVSPVYGFALPTRADGLVSHMLLADDEIPTGFAFPGATLVLSDGKWVRTPPPADAAKLSQDDYVRWVDSWRYASSLATTTVSGNASDEIVTVSLQGGKTLEFRVQSRRPEVRLRRMDENLEYEFAADTGANLLAAGPAAP